MWLKTWFPVIRDLAMFAGGLAGVAYEELSGRTSVPLLLIYTTMLGIPGALGALWMARNGESDGASELPSPPPEPSEPLGPSS